MEKTKEEFRAIGDRRSILYTYLTDKYDFSQTKPKPAWWGFIKSETTSPLLGTS
jgi:hypothetical protein